MNAPPSLSGQLLLAMPGIGDPRFERAVIAICAHDANGALGVGVGRIVPRLGLHRLLAQLDIAPGVAADVPIHFGGPVEAHRGFVLHGPEWAGEDTLKVGDRWALTGTLDVLRALADGTGPARFLVALGYAGWGEGQLDEEMTRATAGSPHPPTTLCCSMRPSMSAGRRHSPRLASMSACWSPRPAVRDASGVNRVL